MGKLKIAQMYGDKPNKGDYDNGIWQNLLDIPFIEKEDHLEPYDVVISTLWLDAIGRSKRVKTRWPNKVLVGLVDHPLSTHISRMSPQQQIAYIKDLEYLDGIMTLTEEERQWYQIAVPSKPVVKVGLPFPFESYTERFGQFVGSEKKYIGLGVGAADNDRNFVTSWTIFQRLKLDYPDLKGLFMSIPSNILRTVTPFCDAGEDIFIHEREGMGGFYDVLSQCKFVINMADRNTPGRLQGEAAFFGVPVIGSNRLELQNELFPQYSVRPFESEGAYFRAKDILDNGYKDGEYALKMLHRYDYTNSKRKFNNLLKTINNSR
jgi:hypothetical protein